MGEALVQAEHRELPAGAPDVQDQVCTGDVAQDVQQDLIREAEKVGAHRHSGCRRGHVVIVGCVLKRRATPNSYGIPRVAFSMATSAKDRCQGQPSPWSVGKKVLLPKISTAEQEAMIVFKSPF